MPKAPRISILTLALGLAVSAAVVALALAGLTVLASEITDNDQASRLGLQAGRDVALTSIETVGPPFAFQGDTVTIRVQATNNGNQDETFQLSLRDDTEDIEIGDQEITLGAGASASFDFPWDTSGASGGPPPPGPPIPGTIHVLTATVSLEHDTVAENNSVSLLPGIWIIAAPAAEGITFPDIEQEPQARFGVDGSLQRPAVKTAERLLSSLFLGHVQSSALSGFSSPGITTGPVALANVYSTMVAGRLGRSLALPGISTILEATARITYDGFQAGLERLLAAPAIDTVAGPSTYITIEQQGPRRGEKTAAPHIETARAQLSRIFATPLDAISRASLESPGVVTGPGATNVIQSTLTQAGHTQALSRPTVNTPAGPLQAPFMAHQSAKSSGGLARSPIDTVVSPQSRVFPGGVQSDSGLRTGKPAVGAKPKPLSNLYTSKGTATSTAARAMANPFESALVKGTVKLQGRKSSLGSYVEAGGEVFFVGRDGSFEFMAPAEFSSVKVDAPGYLPMTVDTGDLSKGGTVVLPEVTLFFGEVNDDNIIDIYDITVAAGNFGRATWSLEPH